MAEQAGRARRRRATPADHWVELFASAPIWLPVVLAGAMAAIEAAIHWTVAGLAGALLVLVLGLGGLIERTRQRELVALSGSLESIRRLPWREFEQLVGEAYRRHGYQVEMTGGGGVDGGVDLILRKQRQTTLVQCKHWRRQVAVQTVRELAGVISVEKAAAGILVATEGATSEARAFAQHAGIQVVDGRDLLQLLDVQAGAVVESAARAHHAEVAPSTADHTCPLCGARMVARRSRYGPFWGCSSYPRCRGRRSAAG